jgi:glycine/D-amino acid oxidase-like deaminating enzyme
MSSSPEHLRANPSVSGVYWLEEALALDPGAPCPPLAGRVGADVCVVGGGFTGLWTAITVKIRHPDSAVVLVEGTGCGFGASGRNGGWATGWHDELDNLLRHFPEDDALWLAEQSSLAIDFIGKFAQQWNIDCRFRQQGALWAAATDRQLGSWHGAVDACRTHGRAKYLEVLDGPEVRERTGSPRLLGAARHTDAAAIQPALLARGLRRVALKTGVRIFEGSPMISLTRGRTCLVHTPAGEVESDKAVMALNAWSGLLPELRRAFVVVGSHIIMTEPVGEQLEGTTWRRGELLEDAQLAVHYSQVTPSGRIAFGGGNGVVASRVLPTHYVRPDIGGRLRTDLIHLFPQLANVRVTHVWGGPVDVSPTHLPFAGTVGDHGNIHYALGYSGNGVAPSSLLGKVLASLATDERDEYATSPLVTGPRLYFPPEPLRTWGGRLVRSLLAETEKAEISDRIPAGVISTLHRLVSTHTPRLLEPRLRQHRERDAGGGSYDGGGRR